MHLGLAPHVGRSQENSTSFNNRSAKTRRRTSGLPIEDFLCAAGMKEAITQAELMRSGSLILVIASQPSPRGEPHRGQLAVIAFGFAQLRRPAPARSKPILALSFHAVQSPVDQPILAVRNGTIIDKDKLSKESNCWFCQRNNSKNSLPRSGAASATDLHLLEYSRLKKPLASSAKALFPSLRPIETTTARSPIPDGDRRGYGGSDAVLTQYP
jgi:hypothetical protein